MLLPTTLHRGSGDRTLLLVHGYTGSQDDFRPVVDPLLPHTSVVTLDLPGHGTAERLPRYSYEIMVASIIETIASLTTPCPVDILGHSMGGRLVIEVVADNPSRFGSMILMDTWADAPDRGVHTERLNHAFALPDAEVIAAVEAIERDPTERTMVTQQWGPEWVERHYTYNHRHLDPLARIQLGRLVFVNSPSVLGRLPALATPTTVLVGELDTPMVSASHRMRDSLTDAELATIDGAYHSPQLTHPAQWRQIVIDHIKRTAPT